MTKSIRARRSKIVVWISILAVVTLVQIQFASALTNPASASETTAHPATTAAAISSAACRQSPRNSKRWSDIAAEAWVTSTSGISCSSAISLLSKAQRPVGNRNVVRLRNWSCNLSGSGGEVIYTKCTSGQRMIRIGYGL